MQGKWRHRSIWRHNSQYRTLNSERARAPVSVTHEYVEDGIRGRQILHNSHTSTANSHSDWAKEMKLLLVLYPCMVHGHCICSHIDIRRWNVCPWNAINLLAARLTHTWPHFHLQKSNGISLFRKNKWILLDDDSRVTIPRANGIFQYIFCVQLGARDQDPEPDLFARKYINFIEFRRRRRRRWR